MLYKALQKVSSVKYAGSTDFAELDNVAHVERDEVVSLTVRGDSNNEIVVWVGGNVRYLIGLKNNSSSLERIDHGPRLMRADDTFELGFAADPTQFVKLSLRGKQCVGAFAPEPIELCGGRMRCN